MKNCLIPLDIIMLIDKLSLLYIKIVHPVMSPVHVIMDWVIKFALKGGMCDKLGISEGDILDIR